MHPFLYLTAASALACAACAGLMCAQWGVRRFGFEAPLALASMAFWATGQLLFQAEPDPDRALILARVSSLGWIFLGPLTLRIFMNSARNVDPAWQRLRNLLQWGAGISAGLNLATPAVIANLAPAPWGYAFVPGPFFLPATAITVGGVVAAIRVGRGAAAHSTPAERRGQRALAIAVAIPTSLAGVNDVLLPMIGVHVPILSPTIFGPFALFALCVRIRMGYSPLTPGQVAGEILEILPDGVALVDAEDRIRLANDGLARLCETSAEQLEGLPVSQILRWNPDSQLETGMQAELMSLEGNPVPVAVRSAEHFDTGDAPSGRVLVVRDLREVAQLRGQLVVSARLAAVGELAAGIAHEINNPLAFVRANLSQLETAWKQMRPLAESSGNPELREAMRDGDEIIEESMEGVDRAVEIVRGVKSFAHAGNAERQLCDLGPLIEDTLKVASAQLRGRVNVIVELDEALPPVLASPQQLKQVFLNLVVNAAQAVGTDGSVLVATRSDGNTVIVSVADDGCGIAPEHRERLFDPFFTTKPVGEGTGLGLGISHQIVARHGGEIEFESEPGQGSVFRVRLPAAEGEGQEPDSIPPAR